MERFFTPAPDVVRQKENDDSSQNIVRGYFYAVRPIDEILNDIQSGKNPDEIPLMDVAFLRKSNDSIPSPERLIPIGGKMLPNEHAFVAAQRKLVAETPLDIIGFADITAITSHQEDIPSFTFEIEDYDKPRRVFSIATKISRTAHRNPEVFNAEEKKFSDIVFIHLDDAVPMIRGEVESDLVEQSVVGKNEGIKIDEDNAKARDMILQHLTEHLLQEQATYKNRLLSRINLDRKWFNDNSEEVSKLSEASQAEIRNAYFDLVFEDEFRDYRELEKKRIKERTGYVFKNDRVVRVEGGATSFHSILDEPAVLDDGSILTEDGIFTNAHRESINLHDYEKSVYTIKTPEGNEHTFNNPICVTTNGRLVRLDEIIESKEMGYVCDGDKIVLIANGKTLFEDELEEDIVLEDGSLLDIDGSVMRQSGQVLQLENNDFISSDGKIDRSDQLLDGLGALNGVDLYTFAEHFPRTGLDETSSLHIRTTHTITHSVNFMKRSIQFGLKETQNLTNIDFPKTSHASEDTRLVLDHLNEFYAQAEPQVVEEFEKEFSKHIEDAIIKRFHLTSEQFKQVRSKTINIFDSEINAVVASMPDTYGDFHVHNLMPLVQDANVGKLCMLALGINPHRFHQPDKTMRRVIQHEAVKALVALTHGASIYERYDELTNENSVQFYSQLMNRLFDAPQKDYIIGRIRLFGHRTPFGMIGVDKVPNKRFENFLPKTLTEKPVDIDDGIRISLVVMPDDNDRRTEIERARGLVKWMLGDEIPEKTGAVKSYLSYSGRILDLFDQAEMECTIEVIDRRHTYDAVEKYLSAKTDEEKSRVIAEAKTGKRSGSIAGLIPRDKFKLRITHTNDFNEVAVHTAEITVYPFPINPDELPADFISYSKKNDDTTRYKFERMFNPLTVKGHTLIGYPSLYNLINPWRYYEQWAKTKKRNENGNGH